MPIVRPVATMDKLEIMKLPKPLIPLNYQFSHLRIAAQSCTSSTKDAQRLDKVHQYEERLDIEGMMERAMAGLKLEAITANQEKAATEFAEFL